MLTRRQALQALAAAGTAALATGLYTWRVEPHWLEFTFPVLPISGLPRELAGRTLAQISDLHIGPQVDDDYIINSFRRVQELAPDFVAFTGDWVTYRSPRQFEQLRRILAHAPHGRLGTVGILGNHDYGINWQMIDVAEQAAAIARAAGVTLLRNQALTVAGLQFLGLDDLGARASIPSICSRRKARTSPPSCSATTPMPQIARSGAVTRAGSLPATRMAASASHRSCRHRSCR